MKAPRVTERMVRENVRQCGLRYTPPTLCTGESFAIAQSETVRGEPRAHWVICSGRSVCTCACGDAPSERQADIRAHWVDDERRKIFQALRKERAAVVSRRKSQQWEDVPDRIVPDRIVPESRAQTNPDRQASADPIWGHTGVTKRTIMTWIAERDGKMDLLLRRSRNATVWTVDDASTYFIETRHAAESLIKALRAAGVPIGWTT